MANQATANMFMQGKKKYKLFKLNSLTYINNGLHEKKQALPVVVQLHILANEINYSFYVETSNMLQHKFLYKHV